MSSDEFTKLSNYLDKRFGDVEAQFSDAKNSLNKIQGSIDGLIKRQEISDDERLVMGHQLERLDKWVHAMAREIGYSLKA